MGGEEDMDREKLTMSRKERRREKKKLKRKQMRREVAEMEREEEERLFNDPGYQKMLQNMQEEERKRIEQEMNEFEERERKWLEAMEKKRMQLEEEEEEEETNGVSEKVEKESDGSVDDDWEYVEEGPAEIIWKGNEIIVKKKKIRVPRRISFQTERKEDTERPTSNPFPPESDVSADYLNVSAQQMLEDVAQQVPNFGTEQDKAHCPFHLKTGVCRFGLRCSRVHFYPNKACTLLIKNMYNGPGISWEQDDGLESYEEFYGDVHTEFLKYGEIVNFKVCRNGSSHLRGNVYIHYKSLDSALHAYQSINGRYFAGRQVNFEFVNVTKWKIAICGEYMKTRLMTCSRGTDCNFIHCFRNPGGDYEWADFDKPPPRSWLKNMAALFGYSDEHLNEKQMFRKTTGTMTHRKTTDRSGDSARRSHDGEEERHLRHHRRRRKHDDVEERNRRDHCRRDEGRSRRSARTREISVEDEHVEKRKKRARRDHSERSGEQAEEESATFSSRSRTRSRRDKQMERLGDDGCAR